MSIVNVRSANTQLARLINQAISGEEVVIARAGKPVARLVPCDVPGLKSPRVLGTLAGGMKVPDTFDDPLPDELLDLFEGR
jgi:prevent-host-death family protein